MVASNTPSKNQIADTRPQLGKALGKGSYPFSPYANHA
jgi:hypothetical protein